MLWRFHAPLNHHFTVAHNAFLPRFVTSAGVSKLFCSEFDQLEADCPNAEASAEAPAETNPNARMRIAMMVSGTTINGVATHCTLLARFLVRRGHRLLLLHRPNASVAQMLALDGVEFFETTFSRRPREMMRVRAKLDAFRPHVIHTHMSSAHAYGMFARILTRYPVVATAHSASLQLHWCFNNLVIATSPRAAAHHIRINRVSPTRMHMIPNMIDTRVFPRITMQERQKARAMLSLPADAFVVGSIGDIGHRKRQIDLVTALARLRGVEPKARLLLVGNYDQQYLERLRRKAAGLDVASEVVVTGGRDDIVQVLAAMDVFALSSRWETGPVAVLEAMARGLPVVATDVGMISEFITRGETGYIVNVGDTEAMSARFVALRDPALRDAIGAAAAMAVRENYDVETIAPKIEAVLAKASVIRMRSCEPPN